MVKSKKSSFKRNKTRRNNSTINKYKIKNSKTHKHKQRLYKMKGCSKVGGDGYLAYPSSNVPKILNPDLAYTGKGGNTSAIYPSVGPTNPKNNIFLSPISPIKGGSGCSSCQLNLFKGGTCGTCKRGLVGGNGQSTYPNGLIGKAWTPNPSGWPGVYGNASDRNHLGYNTYTPVDISRQMVGGKNKKNKRTRRCGGALSNTIAQDFINLGRSVEHSIGNTYNIFRGNSLSPNPLPWKDQINIK